jgi:phosphatidylglycerophosphate synthase
MGVDRWIDDSSTALPGDSILLLRGDYLYDERLLQNLARKPGTLLQIATEEGKKAVAAHVVKEDAPLLRDLLEGKTGGKSPVSLSFETPQTLASMFHKNLRKIDPPYLLPITEKNKGKLEKRLFSGSYKGVTDLVTKWVWPWPARWVTHFCVSKGITPNQVTLLSLVLVFVAGYLFLKGFFALGLAAAWVMTFLDTVDGKLARVTVTSSNFGHIFDHAIDLISPPFWYLAWGLGVESWQPGIPLSLKAALWLIFIGYVAGRAVEGVFKKFLESSGLFCWRPIDSYFRLITGRRNPNLILLTLGLLGGRADLGLLAVALWTVASSIFLVVRLIMGFQERRSKGSLRSWLFDIDPEAQNPTLAQRCFSTSRS